MQQSDAAQLQRCADALERVAEAQERQARAAEIHAGAVAALAHDQLPGRYTVETLLGDFQMYVNDYRRENR